VAELMEHDQATERHRKGGDGDEERHASGAVNGK
jgi:hypothetical protein